MVSGRTGYPARLRKIYEILAARPRIHLSQGLTPARPPRIRKKKGFLKRNAPTFAVFQTLHYRTCGQEGHDGALGLKKLAVQDR